MVVQSGFVENYIISVISEILNVILLDYLRNKVIVYWKSTMRLKGKNNDR